MFNEVKSGALKLLSVRLASYRTNGHFDAAERSLSMELGSRTGVPTSPTHPTRRIEIVLSECNLNLQPATT